MNSDGFSLLEVLIALVIITIVVAASISAVEFLQRQSVLRDANSASNEILVNESVLGLINKSLPSSGTVSITLPNGKQAVCRLTTTYSNQVLNESVEWDFAGVLGESKVSILQ